MWREPKGKQTRQRRDARPVTNKRERECRQPTCGYTTPNAWVTQSGEKGGVLREMGSDTQEWRGGYKKRDREIGGLHGSAAVEMVARIKHCTHASSGEAYRVHVR